MTEEERKKADEAHEILRPFVETKTGEAGLHGGRDMMLRNLKSRNIAPTILACENFSQGFGSCVETLRRNVYDFKMGPDFFTVGIMVWSMNEHIKTLRKGLILKVDDAISKNDPN